MEIDSYYDKNIQELNAIKKECIEISEQHKFISNDEIKVLRDEVDQFEKNLKVSDLSRLRLILSIIILIFFSFQDVRFSRDKLERNRNKIKNSNQQNWIQNERVEKFSPTGQILPF